jgi:uncharacterized membrane protein
MKNTSSLGTWLALLLIIIPLIYLGGIYNSLPETIPLHFDINGKADGFGDKGKLWFVVILMTVVSAGTYLLITNLPKIDPKKTAGQSPELYHKIAIVMAVFLCALSIVIIYSSVSGSFKMSKLMLPLLGLMITLLGNYMHSIKPNYFVGFRTPWTLENEDNWRKTHQLVGKLWVPGGILITIVTLLLPAKAGFIVFLCIMSLITIIPGIYSYLYFKKDQLTK